MNDALRLDAVVLAAGRLSAQDAQRFGLEVKALLPDAHGITLLRRLMHALRCAPGIARIIVVGPDEARVEASGADVWIPERSSGEENTLAGLAQARSPYALLCASDLPFVRGEHIADLLARAAGSDVAYPIFEREEFLRAFPGGRTRFARLGKTHWTGGSMCYMRTALAVRNAPLVRRAFSSRKSLPALAGLFGARVMLRYVSGRLSVADVERRLSSLVGGTARAVIGAHPALAMDCDDAADIEFAATRHAVNTR